jgi:hypothetical protein
MKVFMFQLVVLLTLGYQFPHLQLDSFVKPVVPAGSRAEPQEVLSSHDTGNSAKYPMPYRAVLLMAEMGVSLILLSSIIPYYNERF